MTVSIGGIKFDIREIFDVRSNGRAWTIVLFDGVKARLTREQWMWLDVAREAM
jgi:hypothetical protein